ncbi:hypothetical protein SAMN04487820_111157 [Actinopolyspora mzabensis]|uniref:Cholesterol esterase n=1 Tax=Actinopolyspora mzabensis TaxID=995066 RepID=A0A1G9E6Z5_ACTMZ|nr:DUF6230 family protein [Actinopolyspora mzabensis]SDK71870.1 hypothetical protein SAMN04487820_111157 [Actinopolyspora mzabensis]
MAANREIGTDDGNAPNGRTRWRVFALMLLGSFSAIALMLTGLSKGAVAANFAVSGVTYKASADELVAEGVAQFGAYDKGSGEKNHPVLVNAFKHAELSNFCQSFVVPDLPGIGDATVRIEAPGGMAAQRLVLGVEKVKGDLTLNNVQIGRDASQLDLGPEGVGGSPGAFGIQATGARIDGLRQQAWSTTASTLNLRDVEITTKPGHHPCF